MNYFVDSTQETFSPLSQYLCLLNTRTSCPALQLVSLSPVTRLIRFSTEFASWASTRGFIFCGDRFFPIPKMTWSLKQLWLPSRPTLSLSTSAIFNRPNSLEFMPSHPVSFF